MEPHGGKESSVPLLPSIELIRDALSRSYAVPSFCTWDAESVKTVLDVAEEMRAPVMVMNGWAEFPIIRPKLYSIIVYGLIEQYSIPVSLHLDHGQSLDEVRECIEARYTSVMLDFSSQPLEENINALREVSMLAHPHGITVEGELGSVGMVDTNVLEGTLESTFTDPETAKRYVEETGVDMLAVSIGNAHGLYKEEPNLDFDLLARIEEAVTVPLVLHGGSGTPEADLKRAISMGIAKINVASESVHTVRESLMKQWSSRKNLWVPLAMEKACQQMADVVRRWIGKTGAAGKA
jgi:fructose-bisphosphate aldolase class II